MIAFHVRSALHASAQSVQRDSCSSSNKRWYGAARRYQQERVRVVIATYVPSGVPAASIVPQKWVFPERDRLLTVLEASHSMGGGVTLARSTVCAWQGPLTSKQPSYGAIQTAVAPGCLPSSVPGFSVKRPLCRQTSSILRKPRDC